MPVASISQWIQLAVLVGCLTAAPTASAASNYGIICSSNADCGEGGSCVAGDSVNPVQRCVANPPCTGSSLGNCPGDDTTGQLACIWREDTKGHCSSAHGCKEESGKWGIYKCISLERCDSYYGGSCSATCNSANGQPCNGRGSCQTTDGDPTKFQCQCSSGWNGTRCDNVVDDSCTANVGQCGDHGTCVGSKCQCSGGYTGAQCEIVPDASKSKSGSLDGSSTSSSSQTGTSKTKKPTSPANKNGTTGSQGKQGDGTNNNSGQKKSSGGGSTVWIVLCVLAAAIIVGVIGFAVYSKKRRQQAPDQQQSPFERCDSELNPEGGVITPKNNIVIM